MAKTSKTFSVNDRINHGVYGLGTISEVGPHHISIEFDQAGKKKFLASLVQLEHSDAAPPEPRPRRAAARKPKAAKKTDAKKTDVKKTDVRKADVKKADVNKAE